MALNTACPAKHLFLLFTSFGIYSFNFLYLVLKRLKFIILKPAETLLITFQKLINTSLQIYCCFVQDQWLDQASPCQFNLCQAE